MLSASFFKGRFETWRLGTACVVFLMLSVTAFAADVANVRDFGAKGDGSTDDTAAIQKAIDSGAGVVVFPKGVYKLTHPLVVQLNRLGYTSLRGNGTAKLIMCGEGPAIRLVGTHFRSADPEGFKEQVWQKERMPLVDGVAIEGAHPKAIGIEAVGTMQLILTRIHIRRAWHGIHLVNNNRNVIISNCHIYHNRGVGIFYDNVNLHQSNIVGCHISYNGGGGIVSTAGNVRNIQISGCDLESNMSPDQPPTANILIDCRGSKYGTGEVAIIGCTIQHNHRSSNSANIRIIGTSTEAEKSKDADASSTHEGNVTICGNVLSDVQFNIHLKGCRGVAIAGNTVWKGYQYNLLVEDSSNIVVGANSFDRNPRYFNAQDARNTVVFRNCRDCTISGLHINSEWHSEAALLLEKCQRMNITGCTILDSDGVGLWLKNVQDSCVSGCLIRDARKKERLPSVRISNSSNILLTNNLLDCPPELQVVHNCWSRGNVWPGNSKAGKNAEKN